MFAFKTEDQQNDRAAKNVILYGQLGCSTIGGLLYFDQPRNS